MKPIQYYIGILSVLGYVYCLPVVGQVEDKVVRKGNPRLEYTDVKTGRSLEGKMFTVSFNIVESINREVYVPEAVNVPTAATQGANGETLPENNTENYLKRPYIVVGL